MAHAPSCHPGFKRETQHSNYATYAVSRKMKAIVLDETLKAFDQRTG